MDRRGSQPDPKGPCGFAAQDGAKVEREDRQESRTSAASPARSPFPRQHADPAQERMTERKSDMADKGQPNHRAQRRISGCGSGRRATICLLASLGVAISVAVGIGKIDGIIMYLSFRPSGRTTGGQEMWTHRTTGMVFVRIPGGAVGAGERDYPERNVDGGGALENRTVRPFLIARTEVSQEDWVRIMGRNPSATKDPRLPVHGVSLEDCFEFCERAGFSVPTEMQWERACRGGSATAYSFGERPSSALANAGRARDSAVPVGSLPENPFGLCEMHGNVAEWCTYLPAQHKGTKNNSQECHDSTCGVLRGGHFEYLWEDCRSDSRWLTQRNSRHETNGFRPAYAW